MSETLKETVIADQRQRYVDLSTQFYAMGKAFQEQRLELAKASEALASANRVNGETIRELLACKQVMYRWRYATWVALGISAGSLLAEVWLH